MKLFKNLSLFIIMLLSLSVATAQKVDRIEPLNWWVGMKTPLQMMLYGKNLTDAKVVSLDKGVIVTNVHNSESEKYLFVDVTIANDAKPGIYKFEVTKNGEKSTFEYSIKARRENSATRSSFSGADMVYLLMPDRFANGDPSNDNVAGMAEIADRGNKDGRHGGDIKGIMDHLDYLEDLGVTAIWSTPLLTDNESSYSYHGYACADYYNIDPRFGDNMLYKEMVDAAHKRGIKIIMDMVPNHIGSSHQWMKELPFEDWINQFGNFTKTINVFSTNSDPNASKSDLEINTRGWFDKPMPDLNMQNPYLYKYLTQMAIWWTEWANLDGLRVDTFPYNDKEKAAQWVAAILEEYPNLNIVGECWTGSPAMVAYWDGATKNSDGYSSNLPSVMDFPLQEALQTAFSDENQWGGGLTKVYNSLAHDFVYNDPRTLMIFSDNHDTHRTARAIQSNPKKAKLINTMLATLRGVPQIYYGDELMFLGDPEGGHGGERMDFTGGWTSDKTNLFSEAERTDIQRDVFDHTRRLFRWRKTADVIHNGKTTHFVPLNNLYVYFRYTDHERVMVIVNGSKDAQTIDTKRFSEMLDGYSLGVDILTNKSFKISENITIPAMSSLVMELKK